MRISIVAGSQMNVDTESFVVSFVSYGSPCTIRFVQGIIYLLCELIYTQTNKRYGWCIESKPSTTVFFPVQTFEKIGYKYSIALKQLHISE